MKIVFATSECVPFVKTGGLGDAVSGLAKAMNELGHEVRLIMPLYSSISRSQYNIEFLASSCVHMGKGEEQWVAIYEGILSRGLPVWFVECERYFDRPGVYSYNNEDYLDNAFRFSLFSKAVLQICKDRSFIPHVIHANDWPTSLVPIFMKTWDRVMSPLSDTASVLTIHNVGYQGVYSADVFEYIGIGSEYYNSNCLEAHGHLNMLKGGIATADALTTVSPTHAKEICEPEGGMGMAPYLNNRKKDLFGILNGVDYDLWNPATDEYLPQSYHSDDMTGKLICKRELQIRMGLEQRDEVPLIGLISRLAEQKGVRILEKVLGQLIDQIDLQFVALGSGDKQTEEFLSYLAARFPGKVGVYIGFSSKLSHLIEAGADFFLMPSLYEPCGLNQIYSLKYGTIPIVRATGGLEDTVLNWDPERNIGTGIKFQEATSEGILEGIKRAMHLWHHYPEQVEQMRLRGMKEVFCWKDSARQYLKIYDYAIKKRIAVNSKTKLERKRISKNFMLDALQG